MPNPDPLLRPLAVQLENLARDGWLPAPVKLRGLTPSSRKRRLLAPVGLKKRR